MSNYNTYDLDLAAARADTLAKGQLLNDAQLKKEAALRRNAANNATYDHAMKIQSLQKELAFMKTIEYATVKDRENTLKYLQSEIDNLTKSSNYAPEPYEENISDAVPESAPEALADTASVPQPTPVDAPQPPQQPPSQRKRRSMDDVYAGLNELYLWLLSQTPANTLSLGSALGFLHGCICCLLFPRFVSFLLFLLASSLALLATFVYRDIDMTPRQSDSITVCGGFFGLLALLMFFMWVMT